MPFINRYSENIKGALTFTGNTAGLSKLSNANLAGQLASIGAFTSLNATTVGDFPQGTTLNIAENGSAAQLVIPPTANVVYAELIWGGNYFGQDPNNGATVDISSQINNSVIFTTPLGSNTIAFDPVTAQQDTISRTIAGLPFNLIFSLYERSADVTALVQAAGPGTYSVKEIPGLVEPIDNLTSQTNNAGWTLAVAYEDLSMPYRNLNIWVGAEIVDNTNSPTVDVQITGFNTPPIGPVVARLLVSAQEGDATGGGDELFFGPDLLSLTAMSGPNNPFDNFFASQINNDSGNIDTTGTFGTRNQDAFTRTNISAGRQGWDITNIDASSVMTNNQTSAIVRFTTIPGTGNAGESYMPNTLGTQIDIATPIITVNKQADKTSVVRGEPVLYTLTITNTGTIVTDNFTLLNDIAPSGTTIDLASINIVGATGPIVNNSTTSSLDIQLGPIAVGQLITLQFLINTNASTPSPVLNTASVSYSFTPVQGEPPISNTSISNTTSIQALDPSADISVVKTGSPNPVIAGNNLTYTMVVNNAGPSAAESVTLTDTVPTCLLNPVYSVDGGATNPWPVSGINLGTIAAGGPTITVTISGTVDPACQETSLTNTATVSSTTFDPNLANNTSTVTTDVNTSADISVVKTGNPNPITAGNDLTYSMVINNAGPSAAQSVVLADPLPTCLLNPVYSINGGPTNPWPIGGINLGTIAPGAPAITVTITGTVNPACQETSLTNTATVSSTTFDPNLANNTSTITTDVNYSADISVVKTGNPNPVVVGNTLTYSMAINNVGPSAAQSVALTDPVPTCLLNPLYSINGGPTTSWPIGGINLGALAPGAPTVTVTITGTVNPACQETSLTNTATVASSTFDPNLANNTSTIITDITPSADISVIKTGSPNPVIAGNNLTYTMIVNNAGPSAAESVTLTDPVPTCLLNPVYSVDGGPTNPWPVGGINLGTLAAGSPAITVTISGTVDIACQETILTNTATVSSPTPDPDPTNNTSTVTTGINSSADISVVKTGSPNPVVVGNTLTYSMVVNNAGPSAAESVTLTDTVPACLLNPVYSVDGGATNPWPVGGINLGTIAAGAPAITVTISGTVDPACQETSLTNTATVTSPTFDPNPTNNTSTVTTGINSSADISVVKTGSPNPVVVGNTLTYSMTINNAGPSAAESVTLTDPVPACLLNPVYSVDGGATSPWPVGGINLGTIASGDPAITVTISGTVDPACQQTSLTNTATVTSPTFDPNLANNTSTITTDVTPSADISVVKTSSPNPVVLGNTLTYSIVVSNVGPSAAESVALTDTVPTCLLNPVYSVDGGPTSPWPVGGINLGTIASGAPAIAITISGTVDPACQETLLTNTATVTSPTFDPNLINNTSTVTTGVTDSADISVVKTGSPNPVIAGNNLTYTMVVNNAGPSAAESVALTDPVPACLLNPVYSVNGGATSPWPIGGINLGTIASGAPAITVTISGTVDPACQQTILTNTATVSSTTFDPNLANNTSTITTGVDTSADISVVKTGSPNPVIAGNNLTYTMVVNNTGPSAAESVALTDALPNCLLNPVYSVNGGATSPWPVGGINLGTIASGAPVITVTISGTVDPACQETSLTNTATVTSPTPDPDPTNNTSTITTGVDTSADTSVVKTGSPNPVIAGNNLTYTMVVNNAGPSAAQSVVLTDPVPACLLNPVYSVNGGATSPWPVGGINLGTIAAGAPAITVTISGTVDPACQETSLTNTATVSSTTFDPNLSNNTSTITTTVDTSADISVVKTGSPNPVIAGNDLTYTMVVNNAGPSAAQSVALTDTLPNCLFNPVYSVNGGATSPWPVGGINLGTIASGAPAITVTISGTVDPACAQTSLTNTATVTSPTPDPDPTNNTSTITTGVDTSADISVVKTGSPNPVVAGNNLTYTMVVNNAGPSAAESVALTDPVPACLLNPVYSVNGGATNPWPVGGINLGTIAAGAPAITVTISGTVDPACTQTSLTNTATVTSPTPDPDPTNNTSTITTAVDTSADISVVKTGSPNPVIAGNNLTYTMVVNNAGPSAAESVALTDPVPACLLNPVYSVNGGATSPWPVGGINLGTIAAGAPAITVTISGTVDPACQQTILTNTATVSSTTFDPNLANNTSSITTGVDTSADISVVKTGSPNPVIAGNNLTYTMVVNNAGPSAAESVALTDPVPACLLNPVYSINGGATNPWPVSGTNLGTIAAGAPAITVTISGTVDPACQQTSLTNTATVTSATPDPNPTNNSSTAITRVNTLADVSVVKTAIPNPVVAGEVITYTIVVNNAGPSDAQGVSLADNVPATITGVQFSIDGGTSFNPWISPYNIGTLSQGASTTIIIRGTVVSGATGNISNTATVTSSTPDPNPTNNTSTVITEIDTSADISVVKTGNPNPVIAGNNLTYTMVVNNAGPSAAQSVALTDPVPACLLNPVYSVNGGASSPWPVGGINLGTIEPNAPAINVTISGTIDSACQQISLTNTATVSSPTPDPDPTNNTSTVITAVDTSADISVVKTGSPDPVVAGNSLTYTMVVNNAGPSAAQSVALTDPVPACLLNPVYSVNGGANNPWPVGGINLGTIAPGAPAINVTISGTVNPACQDTSLTNTATVTSQTPDPNPNNNNSTTTTEVNTSADISVVKTGSPNPVIAGNTLTYTMVVNNAGPSAAQSVALTDPVPACLLNPVYSVNGGANNPWPVGGINLGTIAPGAPAINVTISGTVNPACQDTSLTNTATVSSQTPDPNPNNNSSTINTRVNASADISVVKTASPNPVVAGESVTYTIIVSNVGPSDAQGVSLADNIPATITGVQFSINGGATFNPWVSPYIIGTLAQGSSVTILIRGTVVSGANGIISNTATATSTTPDPDPTNNTSTIVTPVNASADLSVIKTASPNPFVAGESVTYTLVVSNAGPSDAQAVSLADAVPETITSAQFSIDGGLTFNPWVSPYNLGTLVSGASKTILIKGTLMSSATGSINNTATVSSPTPDPDPTNNTSTIVTPIIASADLSIVKTSTPNPVVAGENVTYTIVVSNTGPSDAKAVNVADVLPATITGAQFSIDGGVTFNPWVSPYNLGTLVSGASKTILIKGKVVSGATGSISNTAIVSSQTPDPNPTNNTSTIVTPVRTSADLSVIKTSSQKSVLVGKTLTYTVVVSNAGPSDAQAVSLADTIPGAITGVQFSIDGGITFKPWVSPYNIGTIVAGAKVTILIKGTATAAAMGILSNTAVVNSITPDPDPTNNASTVEVEVFKPELILNKNTATQYAIVGDILNYTIIASNTGNIALNNVLVSDVLSSELEFVSGSVVVDGVNIPLENIISGVNVGTILIGSSKTLTFKAKVLSDEIKNVSNISLANYEFTVPGGTPQSGGSSSNEVLVKVEKAHITLKKTADKTSVSVGDVLTYTVKLTNDGTLDAFNVIFTDKLPDGTQLVNGSFNVDGKVINSVDLKIGVNIGTIKASASVTVQYKVTVVAGNCNGLLINEALVKFKYVLPDGTVGSTQSIPDSDSSTSVNVNISNFKQISVDEYLRIPTQKPDMEAINNIEATIEIINFHVIKTPKAYSNESQNLTGYKLIVNGILNQSIEYTANVPEQTVHSAHYKVPFSSFIILPEDFNPCSNIGVEGIVEDIYYKEIDCRTFFKNVTVLLIAKIIKCSE